MNFFRNNPTDGALNYLNTRRSLWNSGKQGGHLKTQRNNAYATVTINGVGLPAQSETFQKLYGRGANSPKPYPSLESVSITYAGELGHAIHVNVSFVCYLKGDFEYFERNWMRPGRQGSVTFGYVKPFGGAGQTSIKLPNLVVATYEFSTDSRGHYNCRLMMVGPSRFAKSAEAKGGLKDRGKLKYKTKSLLGGEQVHTVASLDELLLYDAQENGQTPTDDMPDNHRVPNQFGDIIVYHPPGNAGIVGGLSRFFAKAKAAMNDDKQWTFHNEYYSLDYVVNRLINDQILGFLKSLTSSGDSGIINNVKIVCDSTVSTGVGYPLIRAADPRAMLILGKGKGTYISSTGQGKDWENDGEAAGAGVSCFVGDKVNLNKIMLERQVITQALSYARADSEKEDAAKQTKPSESTDVLIYVEKFLKEIFRVIAYNTGNLFKLDLIENPNNPKELLVVDTNNGKTDALQVFVFNPIDGDGSTRDLSISSGAGSKDYMRAMFGGVGRTSDINSIIKEDIGEVDSKRSAKINSIGSDIEKKVNQDIPDGNFNDDEIEGLRTLFTEYGQVLQSNSVRRDQVIMYPGLRLSVTLDGVWGFKIGNHIQTTLLPKSPYRIESTGICFAVQNVENTIQNNDWETRLEAILTFASPINYV